MSSPVGEQEAAAKSRDAPVQTELDRLADLAANDRVDLWDVEADDLVLRDEAVERERSQEPL